MSSLRRRLPGIATRKPDGSVMFLAGRIIYASERVQWVQTESRLDNARLVFLIGDSYLYFCERCRCSVYQPEIKYLTARPCCPFCLNVVQFCKAGTRVRVHFRSATDRSWANWWGEVWE